MCRHRGFAAQSTRRRVVESNERPTARRDGHRLGTEIGNGVVQRRLHLGREPEPVIPLLHLGAVSR